MVDRPEQPPADEPTSEPVTETDRDQHLIDTTTQAHRSSRFRRRPVLQSLAGTGLAAITGVAPVAASETASDQPEGDSDPGGDTGTDETAEPELVADLEPPALPENLALDDSGTVYLSLAITGELLAVDPDGNQESVAQFDVGEEGALLGIVAVDGTIYALVNSGDPETHGVWTVDIASGDTERMAELPAEETAPNGITVDPYTEDGFLVTDHLGGAIWRVTPDDATVWVDDEVLDPDPEAEAGVGADGIAINPDGDVYVDNLDYGRIVRVPVSEDGSPGELGLVAEEDSLVGADGMTFDSQGRLYVAVNARDAIARVELGSEAEADESTETETDATESAMNETEPAGADTDESSEIDASEPAEADANESVGAADSGSMETESETGTETTSESTTEAGSVSVETLAEGGLLDFPADVAFGRTDADETFLYACNFAIGRFEAEEETAEPSLVRFDIGATGAFFEPNEFVAAGETADDEAASESDDDAEMGDAADDGETDARNDGSNETSGDNGTGNENGTGTGTGAGTGNNGDTEDY
ncbi:SMP-30/gluconolactonase/LRE family protein [Natrialba taiwanensis]|uniref:Uncharacterized protein n=1 Tax=Natrialba taiwanensis DSM 12281 TaxID=1230458 RepID=L9ZPP3_9EURY|nr:SMP-30/gluconolactonase/LRE family protein [Natrialba taiwanensis]ELY87507.1 hypothetical protein C484_17081 [Natrialba taiwanensis DSM 12281]